MKTIDNYLTAAQASELIGCTDGRVRQMLRDGLLIGLKVHERAWLVEKKSAEKMRKNTAKTGRPRKSLNKIKDIA